MQVQKICHVVMWRNESAAECTVVYHLPLPQFVSPRNGRLKLYGRLQNVGGFFVPFCLPSFAGLCRCLGRKVVRYFAKIFFIPKICSCKSFPPCHISCNTCPCWIVKECFCVRFCQCKDNSTVHR